MKRKGTTSREGMVLRGAARDLVTDAAGVAAISSEATVEAELGPERVLRSLRTTPTAPGVEGLIGQSVAAGFRAEADRLLGVEAELQTPLHLLIDDLPVASLIAGYADLYQGSVRSGSVRGRGPLIRSDICAGWAAGGVMLRTLKQSGELPTPVGPLAPPADPDADPFGWHEMPQLEPGAMRRRRLVDVSGGDHLVELVVRAMLRDTHVDAGGVERVLHEYELYATVDKESGTFTRCEAVPRVLPWPECPSAAASATDMVGLQLPVVRQFVRANMRGIETCTHLNDLLRSLADVAPLAVQLAE